MFDQPTTHQHDLRRRFRFKRVVVAIGVGNLHGEFIVAQLGKRRIAEQFAAQSRSLRPKETRIVAPPPEPFQTQLGRCLGMFKKNNHPGL